MAPGAAKAGSHPQPSGLSFPADSYKTPRGAETLTLALKATECLEGRGAFLHWWDPAARRLRMVAASGLAAESAEAWADLSAEQDVAPIRAMRRGHYAWVAGDSLGMGAAGTAAVPLLGADGPVGVLSVITAGPGEPEEAQRSFLRSVAGWAAARLEDLPSTPPVRRSVAGSERTVQMGKLTSALAEAVTSREVVQAVAAHVLPPFGADGLIVWVFESGRQHVVDSAGYTQEFLSLLDGLAVTDYPVAADVFGTCAPRFIESAAEYCRRYPTLKPIPAASQKNAWAFLPMIASGNAIGMCLVSFTRQRSFTDEERTLLTALSGLVGQSLARARLYDVEHARAQELQRGLLPRTLPRLPAACAAARYLPAGRGEQVGGDWYDVIPLSADRVAMVIGDVMGHGTPEAATMGQLRTAVRTLADLDIPPAELLSRLNDLVSDLSEDCYATCLYAVFDPITRICSFSLAGHPPPVVVHPDGTVHRPDLTADPPLGAAEPPFETHQMLLPEESLLVLYTDGLVESATRFIDQGLTRLQQVLAQHAVPTFTTSDEDDDVRRLDDLCDTVVSALLPDHARTNDDAALLIAHTRAIHAGDVASWILPEDPRAAKQAREHVRNQLAAWELDELAITTELLASELVGNVIRHAKGPIRLRLLRSRSLTCEVYDGSLSTPRIRHAAHTDEGGRGLQLVAALSKRWGARYHHDGKCIWTEQDIPHHAA
ncbi:SpoIIE family protein phosphatase [Streptomyces mirabilis]|uniref:SpoIIE family protein phosphatase n=1 Tax=Streptomyces mirabilis TaxID=68239 RepID=UPI002E28B1B9|nr:SpoIIE family protein phosphatase [Streptomyces mirabilis]